MEHLIKAVKAGVAGFTANHEDQANANPIACTRCQVALEFKGTKRFHEGTRWSVLGELGTLFENREHFDVYVCPRCGRVELFVDGIGEDLRPR